MVPHKSFGAEKLWLASTMTHSMTTLVMDVHDKAFYDRKPMPAIRFILVILYSLTDFHDLVQ